MKKAVSDSYLNHYWRKAVLAAWQYRCGLCWQNHQSLECHHIIRRRRVLTRWDWRNSIPLCPQCHQLAHTEKGRMLVAERSPYYHTLVEMEQQDYKGYLAGRGITDNEFRAEKLVELKKVVADAL